MTNQTKNDLKSLFILVLGIIIGYNFGYDVSTSHFRKKLLEPSEIAKETSIALWQAELDKLNLNSDRKN